MVQQHPGGPPLQQGAFYPQRESDWSRNDRNTFLDTTQEPRLPNIPIVQRRHEPAIPATIDSALKDHCGISGLKRWALIVQTDLPEPRIFTSQSLRPYRDQFFTEQFRDSFMSSALKAEAREGYQGSLYHQDGGMYSEFELEGKYDTRKQSSGSEISQRHYRKARSEDSEGSVGVKRKRKGYGSQYREKSSEEIPVAQSTTRHDMEIGDDAKVDAYYRQRFKDMQQTACKIIGKVFVKLLEPKKQTHHPYTKGDENAPPWWPSTTGKDACRHKEPDHLLKHERIQLLAHIIQMIVKPTDKQHPCIQKLDLNVKKLESATMEMMSPWFSDKENPGHELRRPFLKEIFKVAKIQERYKRGEIDGTTIVPVRYGESIALEDDSEGDGENYQPEQEDGTVNNSTQVPTPESLVSPSMSQHQQFQQADDHSMRSMRAGLPMRYNAPMDQMGYEDQTFRGMNQYQPHSPTTIDPSRRSYIPPPVFPSPQQSMFSTGWTNPVSSAPATQYYTTSPQSSIGPFLPLPQPQTTHMSQPVHSFGDGLTRYDTSPAMGSQVRTGSLGHPHHQMPNPAAFQDYLNSDNGQFGQHPDLKDDHQQHQHQHHLHQQN
ncbi:hypothetical protein ONS95_008375 [Cadophora gregata]|uniref:uncharacterized protein n=1 Tax=Cadophora gregata TaxID=51156 RepID=UPI0026DD3FA3|nr:uncharacterized protein ONS95_008375 [Cadophora gregata]KAK0100427.1 hypothetical protein ONS96_007704 [Cadophora gregata f. sp. sojae]KAK0126795.1 hypothetical protein ONS95_008375 [Cadophora gregata]